MWFKEIQAKNLKDKASISQYRYEASLMMFVLMTYLFFVFFFLIASGYFREMFEPFLTPSYILMLQSIAIFAYFYGMKKFSKKIYAYVFIGLVFAFVIASFVILFI